MGFEESEGFGQEDSGGAWSMRRHPEIFAESSLEQMIHIGNAKKKEKQKGWDLIEKHMNPREAMKLGFCPTSKGVTRLKCCFKILLKPSGRTEGRERSSWRASHTHGAAQHGGREPRL